MSSPACCLLADAESGLSVVFSCCSYCWFPPSSIINFLSSFFCFFFFSRPNILIHNLVVSCVCSIICARDILNRNWMGKWFLSGFFLLPPAMWKLFFFLVRRVESHREETQSRPGQQQKINFNEDRLAFLSNYKFYLHIDMNQWQFNWKFSTRWGRKVLKLEDKVFGLEFFLSFSVILWVEFSIFLLHPHTIQHRGEDISMTTEESVHGELSDIELSEEISSKSCNWERKMFDFQSRNFIEVLLFQHFILIFWNSSRIHNFHHTTSTTKAILPQAAPHMEICHHHRVRCNYQWQDSSVFLKYTILLLTVFSAFESSSSRSELSAKL